VLLLGLKETVNKKLSFKNKISTRLKHFDMRKIVVKYCPHCFALQNVHNNHIIIIIIIILYEKK